MNLRSSIRPAALLVLLLALSVAPPGADARILLLDAHFDNRPVGSQLGRRGALFGEPVEGQYDSRSEVIYEDSPGQHSVRLLDTRTTTPDNLYWALRDGLGFSDGKLFISCELELEYPEDYHLSLRSEDLESDNFFQMIFDASGDIQWRDGDSPNPTSIGFYPVGVPMSLEWAFDLDNGTYSFTLNGVEHITDETHGLAGASLGALIVGHRNDADLSGALRFDNPSVSWRPGSIPRILDANFNNYPPGTPIGMGGAEFGEPVYIGGCVPTVELGPPLGSRALLIPDESSIGTASVRFGFLGDVEPSTPLSISFWMTLDELELYYIGFREQGTTAQTFLNIQLHSSGQVFITDSDPPGAVNTIHSYTAGTPIRVEVTFEPDFDYYSIWWNGERIVHRESHGITGREVGQIAFGCQHDADLDGAMRIDNLKVHTLDLVTAVPEDHAPTLTATLQAAPNPFNPATEVSFELPRGGATQVDIHDSRGRLVRRLLAADLPAGAHRVTWRGHDAAGQRMPSGVYHVVLSAPGLRESRSVVLVK
jgi:hypothetical protein